MKFITTPSTFTIILERSEQVAALRAKIVIERREIKTLTWHDKFRDWRKWEVRMPGTSLPKRLIAGSFWTEDGWDFLYLRYPVGFLSPTVPDVLCLELDGHERFRRVVLSATKQDYQHLQGWLSSQGVKQTKIKTKKKAAKR